MITYIMQKLKTKIISFVILKLLLPGMMFIQGVTQCMVTSVTYAFTSTVVNTVPALALPSNLETAGINIHNC